MGISEPEAAMVEVFFLFGGAVAVQKIFQHESGMLSLKLLTGLTVSA